MRVQHCFVLCLGLMLVGRALGDDAAKQAQLEDAEGRAKSLMKQGKKAEAITEYEKAVALALDVLGPDREHTGFLMACLALLYRETGQYAKAEPLYSRALEIVRQTHGPDDKHVQIIECDLGEVCSFLGDYPRAETLLKDSLDLAERRPGGRADETADALRALGHIYSRWGRYKMAEQYLQRALRFAVSKLGPDHVSTALAVNALAELYMITGRYDEADPLIQRALKIMERDPKNAISAAQARDNLAVLDISIGRYEEALVLLRRSRKELEGRLPEAQLEMADCLNSIGVALTSLGRPNEAVTFLDESVATLEAAAGKDAPILGIYLNNQGGALMVQGEWDSALERCQRSRRILEKALGEDNPDATIPLSTIAYIYFFQGDYAEAHSTFQQCLDILAKAPAGADLPQYAYCLWGLGILDGLQGKGAAAEKLGQSLEAEQRQLRRVFRFTSEPAMLDYLATIRFGLPHLISLAHKNPDDAALHKQALTWVLRRKTVVVDTLSRYREVQRLTVHDPDLAQLIAQRSTLAVRLQNLTPQPGDDGARFTARRASLVRQADDTESNLHQMLSRKYPSQLAPDDEVDADAAQKKLLKGSVLIELVRTNAIDYRAKHGLDRIQPPHYYAFVLAAGTAAPKLFDLGDAKAIDDSLQKVRDNFEVALKQYPNDQSQKENEEAYRPLARELYDQIFGPLRSALGEATLVYLASDGELSRLPFEALVDEDGKYLVKTFRFAYLSGGRDLLRSRGPVASGTTVFAGPNFDMTAKDRLVRAKAMKVGKPDDDAAPPLPDAVIVGSTRGGLGPLSGAAAEAEIVKKALSDTPFGPVHVYQGDDALEEELKAEPAPRVLHLATHGRFFPRPEAAKRNKFDSIQLQVGLSAQEGRLGRLDDPMMRSVIYLAGANVLAEAGRPEGVDDGWVTAAEVAQLNLHGTELVVLSACETGLGDVRTGEGVSGLRQAFQYAGARTLLTSLFEVPDSETRDMMRQFYDALHAGKGKLAALHDAQLAVLKQRQAGDKGTHPFFWAAFILVGDPE